LPEGRLLGSLSADPFIADNQLSCQIVRLSSTYHPADVVTARMDQWHRSMVLAMGWFDYRETGLTLPVFGDSLLPVNLDRARESLKASELCLAAGLVSSAASRAYYAMFQVAQVGLVHVGVTRAAWSHPGLQAAFATELVSRRKVFPAKFRDYLSAGLAVRLAADYGRSGVSMKVAQRLVRRASEFVASVEERLAYGTPS
jgi:uncharacterized protein (UPF0332 family)